MAIKIGEKSPKSAIYKCSSCGNLHAMLEDETAGACEICSANGKTQQWKSTGQELMVATRNVRREIERKKTVTDRASDAITAFCGNIHFVYVHVIWFAAWLLYNSFAAEPFDPYPFGMLTLVVSLEAILLATFILMSQNRSGEVSEMRSELDFQADLRAERNTAEILALLKGIYQETKDEKSQK